MRESSFISWFKVSIGGIAIIIATGCSSLQDGGSEFLSLPGPTEPVDSTSGGEAPAISKEFGTAEALVNQARSFRYDVCLVQDTSASFDEYSLANRAGIRLLDCAKLQSDGSPQFGLIRFTGCPFVGHSLVSISSGYATLRAAILSSRTCGSAGMPACSGGNPGQGIQGALNQFDLHPLSPNALGQVIIIFSDELPTYYSWGCGPGNSPTALSNYALQMANTAWSRGISIYTVYCSSEQYDPETAAFMASLVRGKGIAIVESTASGLDSVFQHIVCEALIAPSIPLMQANPD